MWNIGWMKWAAIGVVGAANVAVALAEDKPRGASPDGNNEIVVYRLENVEADRIATALRELNFAGWVASEATTQSLLVCAPKSTHDRIKPLIAELDAPIADRSTTTAFLQLKHRNAREIADVLHEMQGQRKMRIGMDEANQLVIVSAGAADIEAAKQLAEKMDQPRRGMRLTFFFVLGKVGVGSGAATQLPEGLRAVAATLEKSGFSDLTLLAPMAANVLENAKFYTRGTLDSDFGPLQIEVQGLVEQGGTSSSRVSIQAKIVNDPQGVNATLFTVESTLTANLGDYVVLAAAPTSSGDRGALAMIVRTEAN